MKLRDLCVALSVLSGCDAASDAAQEANNAAAAGKELASQATEKTKNAYSKGKDAVDAVGAGAQASADAVKAGADAVKESGARAKALWDDVPDTGELSTTATNWLKAKTDQPNSAIEGMIIRGQQIAPVAMEISKTIAEAVESEIKIEPIFQPLSTGQTSDADNAIGKMPRVEVIDGLSIGFKQLDETSAKATTKERAYLVMWRDKDRLIGFVYRSKRTIDLETLVAETPRLVRLTRTALAH